jgi:heptosyltransferase-2
MSEPRNILVVQPSWVGDAIMATPTLRAIRARYPDARITYLMKRYVKPLYSGMPWVDRLITYRTGKTKKKAGKNLFELAARIRSARFDMAILLPNSFQSALICKMSHIPRIIGYDRDGRGFLLTDKLVPAKDKGKFVPTPLIKTYLGLSKYLAGAERDITMKLFVTDGDRRDALSILDQCGLEHHPERPHASGGPPLIILNPGAQYGAAKCWRTDYFAQLADRFIEKMGATVLISSAPRERQIVDEIMRSMKRVPVDLAAKGLTLGSLKEIVRRCDLMVTNDTGPRHIAAAFDVPVVTIFGPTFPEWTEIYYAREMQVSVKVFCGPCQKKICPLDHRCMTEVTVPMVYDASMRLLNGEWTSVPASLVTGTVAAHDHPAHQNT